MAVEVSIVTTNIRIFYAEECSNDAQGTSASGQSCYTTSSTVLFRALDEGAFLLFSRNFFKGFLAVLGTGWVKKFR